MSPQLRHINVFSPMPQIFCVCTRPTLVSTSSLWAHSVRVRVGIRSRESISRKVQESKGAQVVTRVIWVLVHKKEGRRIDRQ